MFTSLQTVRVALRIFIGDCNMTENKMIIDMF